MYTPYGLHSMSKQCRVEAPRAARRRRPQAPSGGYHAGEPPGQSREEPR